MELIGGREGEKYILLNLLRVRQALLCWLSVFGALGGGGKHSTTTFLPTLLKSSPPPSWDFPPTQTVLLWLKATEKAKGITTSPPCFFNIMFSQLFHLVWVLKVASHSSTPPSKTNSWGPVTALGQHLLLTWEGSPRPLLHPTKKLRMAV